MGGKYEIRYYLEDVTEDDFNNYNTVYTNNWFEFIKLRLTKRIIYYKVNVN